MNHYLFTDYDTDEDFVIDAYKLEDAYKEAREFFTEPVYLKELTEEEVKATGLYEY